MPQEQINDRKCRAYEAFGVYCSNFVAPGFRKYCFQHSQLASRLWKRRERQPGGSYYRDWRDRDKASIVQYSRASRQRRRRRAVLASEYRQHGEEA